MLHLCAFQQTSVAQQVLNQTEAFPKFWFWKVECCAMIKYNHLVDMQEKFKYHMTFFEQF